MLYYQDNLGNETVYKEYKLFNFFNSGLGIDNETSILLIKNKKWIFNNNVIENLKCMIKMYLPKYTCAYLSNNMAEDSYLYFGIDDFGDVIGIPYEGNLDEKSIKSFCKKIINNNCSHSDNLLKYINIELVKIDHSQLDKIKYLNNKDKIHPYYSEYEKNLEKYNYEKNKYLKKKEIWGKLNERYNGKLSELVNNNDTKYELINFIENKSPNDICLKILKRNDFKMPSCAGNPKVWHVGFYFKVCTFEENITLKEEIDLIFKWVAEWKDKMLSFLKAIKPYFYYKIPSYLYPLNILRFVKPMMKYWLANNNLNLYIIKFTFRKKQKLNILYKNILDEWLTCKRVTSYNGPCCVPMCNL
jgi:hypothetical protein